MIHKIKKTIKISLLMPTRGRPLLVNRFLKSLKKLTCNQMRIEVIIYVDDDDYESHSISSSDLNIKVIIGPRKTMGAYNTECYEKATGDVIILVNDDMVIQTKNWDLKIDDLHNSIEDQIYLAYGNDLFKGKDLCAFPILSKKTCELLKRPYPIEYRGAFIDTHLFDIFKRLEKVGVNRTFYMEDLIFEHMHYRLGKAEKDQTYVKRGRFDDDPTFVALTNFRKENASALYQEITGHEFNSHSRYYGITETAFRSYGLISAIIFITMNFLLDRNLPFKWRFYLWYWFIARTFARFGYLKFLGIK